MCVLGVWQREKILHLNEQSAKSAGRLLQTHTGSGESCSDQSVFGRAPPLPVLNEGNFEKVAGMQSKLKKYWRRNAVLSFCVTSSSAEKRRLFVVFTLKKQDVIWAGTQTYKHPLPINALLF